MIFIIIDRVIIIHDEVHDIDRELTLNIVSEVKHRTHRFFRKCKEPDNWILVDATDKFGFEYECWYFIEDMDNFNLDNIDYNNPKDVITKKREIIYKMMYEVKFIIKDHYQYTGEDITDYDYINPFNEGEYTEAENAAEALQIVIEQIAEWYEYNGSMVVNYGGNHILLINPYDEYTEYCRGIAIPISA